MHPIHSSGQRLMLHGICLRGQPLIPWRSIRLVFGSMQGGSLVHGFRMRSERLRPCVFLPPASLTLQQPVLCRLPQVLHLGIESFCKSMNSSSSGMVLMVPGDEQKDVFGGSSSSCSSCLVRPRDSAIDQRLILSSYSSSGETIKFGFDVDDLGEPRIELFVTIHCQWVIGDR